MRTDVWGGTRPTSCAARGPVPPPPEHGPAPRWACTLVFVFWALPRVFFHRMQMLIRGPPPSTRHPNCAASRLAPNGEICAARGPASLSTALPRCPRCRGPAGRRPRPGALRVGVPLHAEDQQGPRQGRHPPQPDPSRTRHWSPPLSISLRPQGWPAGGHPHGAGGGAGRPVGRGLPPGSPTTHSPTATFPRAWLLGEVYFRDRSSDPVGGRHKGVCADRGARSFGGLRLPPSSLLLWPSVVGGRSRVVAATPY